MKRKFLSLVLCLMICLSSGIVLSGCLEEKPKPVGEVYAMDAYNTAVTNINNSDGIKMSCEMMGVEVKMIISETQVYAYTTDEMEMWAIKDGNFYEMYLIENIGYDEPEFVYTKSTMPAIVYEGESFYDQLMGMGGMSSSGDEVSYEFVEASKLGDELTINMKVTIFEGWEIDSSFVIKNNILVSMSIDMFGLTMKYNFSYGENVLSEIPAVPEYDSNNVEIVWDECEPKFEIPEIEDVEFNVGDNLSLVGLELNFYTDSEGWEYETIVITEEMIQDFTITGFDSSELTNGTPKEMTISFMGATLTIEYEVVEDVTQE